MKTKITNPFKTLSKFELMLWLGSLALITVVFALGKKFDILVLIASLIGATALIFVSKGDPFGQILTVVFALFYAVISYRLRYFSEMITYLGMTSPAAISATVEWFKNPFEKGKSEVEVKKLSKKACMILWILTALVTAVFFFILKALNTPNLFWSTLSVTASFLASALTYLRSPFYALAYSTNDIILIILWSIASFTDRSYVPMVVCFVIFLINDSYGFINWQRMKKRQSEIKSKQKSK